MATNPPSTPEHITALQTALRYNFNGMRHLVEALRAPGSGFNTPQSQNGVEGYRRLAQLGESLIQTIIIDECYHQGMNRGSINEQLQRLPSTLLERAQQISLEMCISMNPSQQGIPPSPKMIIQSMQAIMAAVYLDSQRNIGQFVETLRHVGLLGVQAAYASSSAVGSVEAMQT
ncbi:hypothetical protein PG985_016366 [Apiospora marii]|uniref:uncharacterized protein n=1 Tax=Apiospora marii TaxID=335849 RepID=UPI0031304311